tara:strand:- start:1188 stop:1364 length:177 start_codon:yes stop_codon:yes gene_type:complete
MRADRSLSGRLVCNSCGTPFGGRGAVKNKINNLNGFSLNRKYALFLFIFIIAFTLVII